MSLKIGITGGIGSGKSLICKIFKTLGVPTYDADMEAKRIMNEDSHVKQELERAFGADVFQSDGLLDRKWLSSQVFENEEKLALLNSIVHPKVIRHADEWAQKQLYPYSIKEAALLFESGSYRSLDAVIVVTAPIEIRVERVIERDHLTAEQVMQRIEKQMSDVEKLKLADYEIVNDNFDALIPQVLRLHRIFLKKSNV